MIVGQTTIASIAASLTLLSGAFAAAIDSRATSPKCVTKTTGILTSSQLQKGDVGINQYLKFHLQNGKLAFDPAQKKPSITAEFQTCTPNLAGGSNKAGEFYYYGRVYIPSTKSCIYITNPGTGGPDGPYYAATGPCLTSANGEMATKKSIPFNFEYKEFGPNNSHKQVVWIGGGNQNGTITTGRCHSYGYRKLQGDNNHVNTPWPESSGIVPYICGNVYSTADAFAEFR